MKGSWYVHLSYNKNRMLLEVQTETWRPDHHLLSGGVVRELKFVLAVGEGLLAGPQ